MNGLPLKVTPNLEEALRSLRDDSEGGQSRTLWVDAICINQTDTLERNHQVAQMQEIYADAQQVIVWLGPLTATSSMAIHFIEELYDAFEELEIKKSYDNDFERMDKKICDALLASTSGREQLEKRWQAVFELMLRPWWDRVVRLIGSLSLSPDLTCAFASYSSLLMPHKVTKLSTFYYFRHKSF